MSNTSGVSMGTECKGAQSASAVQAYNTVRWRLVQVVRYVLHFILQIGTLQHCNMASVGMYV